MLQFTCTKNLCRILHEKYTDTKKISRLYHFIENEKLRKYLSGILSFENDEADLEKKTNEFINNIGDFNNKTKSVQ